MNPILLANLIAQLGVVGLPLISKIMGDITAGRTQTSVTPEDLAELKRLADQSAADIWTRLGIPLPPNVTAETTPAK